MCSWVVKRTTKVVGEHSSGAAGQPWTPFGLLKLEGVHRSAGVQSAVPLPPALRGPKSNLEAPMSYLPTIFMS